MTRPLFALIAILLLSLPAAAQPAPQKIFKAGAATSNITPPLGELIVGGWKPIPATFIHDELHARCLVLDNGDTQLAFVICDNVGIPREVFDLARKHIAAQTTLPPENVMMSSTHTHSATTARGESKVEADVQFTWYQQFLARRIADGIRRAMANLEPARIGWGGVEEPSQLFNRRWYVTDPELRKNPFGGIDEVRMNPPAGNASLVKPAGPIDPEISFISVQSTSGRPIALLGNYSLHYVGGVPASDVSADYFSIFADRIGELLPASSEGPPFVGILCNGTSGDVNNINFREPARSRKSYEKMREVADLVARRVAEAHQHITFHDWVPLSAVTRELTLKVRKPDEAMQKYFAEILARTADAPPLHHSHERTYAERVTRLANGPDEVTVLLQAFRIGDLGIAAIPFEVFTEIGLEIKDQSPFADAFTISLANGSYGYLPTPAQHRLGGYETWMGTNNVQLDASERITESLLQMMEGVQGPESSVQSQK
ncbi:hypothetical protein SAMN05421753_105263 [Planctomicrobium piriforme]|uniref:Neutral/alkaline non-lysosomal ceramidase, N-terminal n=1 Tax=Planctomicrobium piriforme TaxID=1576369 RepID=A0A1I3FIB8_9PLAN|nr:hypothetical protein [Planctomicrobium piriforme]SFI10955.1 hypothetical protein SAMN05421753_105263 [Planctomicrobium piriforme]